MHVPTITAALAKFEMASLRGDDTRARREDSQGRIRKARPPASATRTREPWPAFFAPARPLSRKQNRKPHWRATPTPPRALLRNVSETSSRFLEIYRFRQRQPRSDSPCRPPQEIPAAPEHKLISEESMIYDHVPEAAVVPYCPGVVDDETTGLLSGESLAARSGPA